MSNPIKSITNVGGDGMKVLTTIPNMNEALEAVIRVCKEHNVAIEEPFIQGNDEEVWIQVNFVDDPGEEGVEALEQGLMSTDIKPTYLSRTELLDHARAALVKSQGNYRLATFASVFEEVIAYLEGTNEEDP